MSNSTNNYSGGVTETNSTSNAASNIPHSNKKLAFKFYEDIIPVFKQLQTVFGEEQQLSCPPLDPFHDDELLLVLADMDAIEGQSNVIVVRADNWPEWEFGTRVTCYDDYCDQELGNNWVIIGMVEHDGITLGEAMPEELLDDMIENAPRAYMKSCETFGDSEEIGS